ncbi:alpha/beta hydrolase [Paroceanicella profunda]|uniref:Alpha/beta hydrolase n=1 Tax=Paroceanicella profunda TaxID=2579971 RepID=A0A5B8FFX9_9RHOB|nr:alpha/beta hydrolase [Paroceanicella profunda]QDL90427.1 alpha/beta hydrolase [Paroceanicella profunda]
MPGGEPGPGAPQPLEPMAAAFLATLTPATAPFAHLDWPGRARLLLRAVQRRPTGRPGTRVEETRFPVGVEGTVPVRILRPEGVDGALPGVMYFHGGGWMLGDATTHERLASEIAVAARVAVLVVDLPRSPEVRFPVPLEQAWAATLHAAAQAPALGLDRTRLAVAGDGTGATIATGVALLARMRRGPAIAFQALLYPATDARFDTGSYRRFAAGPWLTRAAMMRFWDAYLPETAARTAPLAAPLRAHREELRGLPETLLLLAEHDVLRDEGEAYGHRLLEAGVRVTSLRCNGTIHDFAMLNALADSPATRGAIAQLSVALRGALA